MLPFIVPYRLFYPRKKTGDKKRLFFPFIRDSLSVSLVLLSFAAFYQKKQGLFYKKGIPAFFIRRISAFAAERGLPPAAQPSLVNGIGSPKSGTGGKLKSPPWVSFMLLPDTVM